MYQSKLLPVCLITLMTLLLQACGGSDGGSDTPGGGNGKSAGITISGSDIGSNIVDVTNLRKSLIFSVTSGDSRIEFGNAYGAKTTGTYDDALYWIVSATNISTTETLCFIRMNGGVFKDSVGNTIADDPFDYINGSVRKLTTVDTDTCLEPGKQGTFFGIEIVANAYNDIVEIVFDNISVDSSANEAVGAKVSNVGSYTATATGVSSFYDVSLPVKNVGTASATMGILSAFLLLDSSDVPLIWGYMSRVGGWDGRLAVGAENTVDDSVLYEGRSNKILFFPEYDSGSAIAALSKTSFVSKKAFAGPEDYTRYLLEQRNQLESIKQNMVSQ